MYTHFLTHTRETFHLTGRPESPSKRSFLRNALGVVLQLLDAAILILVVSCVQHEMRILTILIGIRSFSI